MKEESQSVNAGFLTTPRDVGHLLCYPSSRIYLCCVCLCLSAPDHNSTQAEQVFSCSGTTRADLPWLKMLLLTSGSLSTGNCLSNDIFSLAAASPQLQTSHLNMSLALIMSLSTAVMGNDYTFGHFFSEIKP